MRSRHRQSYERFGEVFFVTTTVVGFVNVFDLEASRSIVIDNLKFYQNRGDFTLLAWVLMPNHLHLVMRIKGELSISQIMGNVKRITSRQISDWLSRSGNQKMVETLDAKAKLEPSRHSRIWKPRFDCLVITNENTLREKIDYIHYNPVRAGLVSNTVDWIYGSAGDYAGFAETLVPVDVEWSCLGHKSLPSGRDS
jgi:putative transposase